MPVTSTSKPNQRIFAIALPMIISNIAAPLLGLVDTAIIGHLPDAIYLSAVALGATAVSFMVLLTVFLRMTTTAEIAAAFGADDHQQQQQISVHALLLALLLGLLLTAISPWLIVLSVNLMTTEPRLAELTTDYMQIRLLALPATLVNLVVLGILIGRQQARQAMLLVIAINLFNVIGNLILIIGFKLNVVGAAWASFFAELSTAVIGLYLIRSVLPPIAAWRVETVTMQRFIGMNTDVMIRSLLLQLCLAMMTIYASRFGTTVVAANAILMQFLLLIALGLDGIAYAVEALVGAARGQGNPGMVKFWMKHSLRWSMLFALAYSVIFWLWGDAIISLLTNLPEVIEQAKIVLPWLWLMPLVAHWSYFYDGVFIGLGYTKAMRNTMAISALAVFFPTWYVTTQLLFSNADANHGLWLALLLFMAARGLSQALWLRGKY